MLATGCNRNTTVYDTTTGSEIVKLPNDNIGRMDNYVRSVAFSPDNKLLVTGSEDKMIRVWDLASRRILRTLTGHRSEIYSLVFSLDGKEIVSGSGDRTSRIWNIEDGSLKKELIIDDVRINENTGQPREAGVTSVAVSPDGKLLAAGSLDHVVRIWELATGKLLEKLRGHKDSVYSVAFVPDQLGSENHQYLLTGSLDKTLKVWDIEPLRKAFVEGATWPVDEGKTVCVQTFTGHKVRHPNWSCRSVCLSALHSNYRTDGGRSPLARTGLRPLCRIIG